jgi:hypothetical protein
MPSDLSTKTAQALREYATFPANPAAARERMPVKGL